MKHIYLFILVIVSLTQGKSQQSLDLQQCINLALDRNLDLKSKSYNLESNKIDLKQAKASKLPNLNVNTRLGINLGKTIDPTSNNFITTNFISNSFTFSSNIQIYNYNKINHLIKQATLLKSSGNLDYKQLEMDIALQVTTSYVNTLFALENLKNSKLQLESNQSQLDQMDIFINSGSRPKNDRLDLVAALAQQEQNIINYQNQYDLSILNLKQLLRLDYTDDLDLKLISEYNLNADAETMTIENLVNKVIDRYPALQAAAINTDISGIQVKIAKSGYYPSITAGVSLGTNYSNQGKRILSTDVVIQEQPVFINGDESILGVYSKSVKLENTPYINQLEDNISYGLGVNMSIPIYNNYTNKASVEKAKLQELISKNNYEKIKNQLVLSLQQVLADAKASKKEMTAADKSYISQQSAYINAQKKYNAGTISSFELLQIKNKMDSAQLTGTIAKYNYIFKVKLLDYYLGIQ